MPSVYFVKDEEAGRGRCWINGLHAELDAGLDAAHDATGP